MMSLPRFYKLINGYKMPSVGLGTFNMNGDKLKEALDYALSIGYRHIDTAAAYHNEKEVGEVLNDRIRAGKVKRNDVFVTSKIPRTSLHRESEILLSVRQSLEDLKILSVDMLLVHSPWPCIKETDQHGNWCDRFVNFETIKVWRAMEKSYNNGLALNIGLSNFTVKQLKSVLNVSRIPVSNVQLEAHAFCQQKNLKQLCDEHNIVVSAYAPLGSPGRPIHHVSQNLSVLDDPLILKLAREYRKGPAQILLNFLVKNGMTVLPKSSNSQHLEENLGCLDWSLREEDFKSIQQLDSGAKLFEFLYMEGHPDFFKGEEF